MAAFTIRVELYGSPTYEQYERLHALMAANGFAKTVYGTSTSGVNGNFDLPTGLYYGFSNLDDTGVADQAKRAANQVQPSSRIFAAETVNWAIR